MQKTLFLASLACLIEGVQTTGNKQKQALNRTHPGLSLHWFFRPLMLLVLHLGCLSIGSRGEEPTKVIVTSPEATLLLNLARESSAQGDDFSAADAAENLLREPELPPTVAAEAWRLVAKGFTRYGTPAGWTKVLTAAEAILGTPNLSKNWRTDALRHGAAATTELRAHSQAELYLRALVAEPDIPQLERCMAQLALARSLWAQRAFEGCHRWMSHMELGLSMLDGAGNQERGRMVQDLRAECQLLRAKCLQMEGQKLAAHLLLTELPHMPGQTSVSRPTREALCLLQRRDPTGGPRRVQRVLFVGSSHTIRGNLPCLIEQIAASAPPQRVRITASEQSRMGTGMRGHWNDGVAHDAARGTIAAGGWDTVVVETFYRTSREDLLTFGSGYAEEVRRAGARLLIYETPVAKAIEYPVAYEVHHQTNVWLGARLKSGVAPCVKAWMGVLGERPEPGALERLYADWIHASARGAYLSACCLYAALTGESPVGLWSPPGLLSPDETLQYQRAAWQAFCETRLALARSN